MEILCVEDFRESSECSVRTGIIGRDVRPSASDTLDLAVFVNVSFTYPLTLEHRCKIATWQEVFPSPTAVRRKFEKVYSRHTAPTRGTVYAMHSKFLDSGSDLDKPRSGTPPITFTDENSELHKQAFTKSQRKSIRRTSLELSINKNSIQRMLQGVIKFCPLRH
ncbi:Hypothetical predicted protein [Octopus vulgaris]|uniref:DUF4817 domain-containing protein n=1 Tax=Octopus vulgaris TaxID=6645 RepID=A0AA36BD46_OCTVU|nr:Hypothetical predicted protein [Octopus vulgaris]